jgi:hypothetical protein
MGWGISRRRLWGLSHRRRQREVAARCQAIPELVEIRREILFKLGDRLTVNASSSPIGLDSFVRSPNISFGDAKRLCTVRVVHPIAG